jgi:hypothetical protein
MLVLGVLMFFLLISVKLGSEVVTANCWNQYTNGCQHSDHSGWSTYNAAEYREYRGGEELSYSRKK